MHLPGLVIHRKVLLNDPDGLLIRNDDVAALFFFNIYDEFKGIEKLACIPAGNTQQSFCFRNFNLYLKGLFKPFLTHRQEFEKMILFQWFQNIDLAAGEEGSENG